MAENPEEFIDNPYFIIFALIIIVSFGLLVIIYVTRCHPTREAILILGLPESGKTAIFSRLAYSRYRSAGTSPSEMIDKCFSLGTRWRIVDTPGQARLKYIFFNYYKQCTKAIIFVINLPTINENKYRIAEYLDKIVSDPTTRRSRLPLLILCNKHDYLPMIDWRSVGRFLEKQIDIYRLYISEQTKDKNTPERKRCLQQYNLPIEPFEFRQCPLRVHFATCPTFLDDSDDSELDEIVDWISTV